MTEPRARVALFVTCLVDFLRPSVGFAAAKLIEDAGLTVEVPLKQTCCGQPAYNAGDRKNAEALARQTIALFEGYDYVVAPSGSCAGMLREHYPRLLSGDPDWSGRARAFAARCHELVSFLTDVLGRREVSARYEGVVTYHDSCSGLREMNVKSQPRQLLSSVEGLTLKELATPEICCGFGGTFCVKYPAISTRLADDKIADILATGADTVLAGDLGCLLNLAGRLKRQGYGVKVRHVAEVLAGMTQAPAIGEGER
ncbi:MAG TPA: (Fe-S)-binding protein [Alphaproteobacteria bacterium]|nr:(Fe-S)-binding protein [Alphaproteobacteria bacterium]